MAEATSGRPRALQLWLADEHVANLSERSRAAGRIDLIHTPSALDRWGFSLPLLSCSLPTSDEPQSAEAWLDGFLPEGQARAGLAAARGLAAGDTWAMLAEFGRDIAGAVRVVDPDRADTDRHPQAIPYTTEQLASAVDTLPQRPLDVHDDSELSLAGVQDKMLLVRSADGWARPVGGHPSTHILKPDPLAHPGVVVLEAAVLDLAHAVGLTTITPQLVEVGGRTCLVVDRYDRRVVDGEVARIHQEDLCQATGRDPRAAHGWGKYERHDGPGYVHAAELLRRHADDPQHELEQLAGAMVLTVLVGNSDAHGKNLSLLLDPPGRVRLAPLYDTVPTMLFSRLAVRCAMEVNGVFRSLEDVTRADLVAEIAGRFRWQVPDDLARRWVDQWMERIAAAAGGDDPVPSYVRRRIDELVS